MAALCAQKQGFASRPRGELQARDAALAADANGVAPLHRAAAGEGGIEYLSEVLKAGANVHSIDLKGCTALHYAATHGNTKATKMLLHHGAKADVCDKEEATPLVLAVAGGYDATAQLLLKARADPCHPMPPGPHHGDSMLVTVCREGRVEAAHVLLLARANPDCPAVSSGVTPVQLAASAGHMELLMELLRAGAQPDSAPRPKMPSVHLPATSAGLLSKTAREAELAMQRPLRLAAEQGHAGVVQALIHAGAEINAGSQEGMSAIAVANARGHTEVFHGLLRAGAELDDARPARQKVTKQRVARAYPQGLKFCLRPDALDRLRGLPSCGSAGAEGQVVGGALVSGGR